MTICHKECLTIAYTVMMPYTALYQHEFWGKYDQGIFHQMNNRIKHSFMLNKYNYESIDYKVFYNTCFTTLYSVHTVNNTI